MTIPSLRVEGRAVPPAWALWQRRLIDVMDEAGLAFLERYTRPDGTLIWREHWPGMDGSDDAYESFFTFPLHYALGGHERYRALARKQWEAITWQFTEYGQLHREFDAYYDWMHHGESYLYFYFLGLSEPYDLRDRQRSVRFARFYTGEDPDAPNYDPEHRLIRSPINGSRGPRLEMTAEDWSTHRWVLSHPMFGLPYDDIPGVPGPSADWNDDAVFERILATMNRRMAKGDVPLNMAATSLLTHAFMVTGDAAYRDWVLDYVAVWAERATANGGILPDNVGLTGAIGEYMDGKWWGGYYGWRWPHGGTMLMEAATIGAMNAVLLTGDSPRLDVARSQIDHLWSLREEIDGEVRVPIRRTDTGWEDYRPMSPTLPVNLWHMSEDAGDAERVDRLPGPGAWDGITDVRGMGWGSGAAWYRFVTGQYDDYPVAALSASYAEVSRALESVRDDAEEPDDIYIQHWIGRNPVLTNTLAQLTTGAPCPLYHGGLLNCRVRYYDAVERRPGLPSDVAALVDRVGRGWFRVALVNVSPQHSRSVILQAGAFGEHTFAHVEMDGRDLITADNRWLRVDLDPAAATRLRITTRRFSGAPSYDTPWRHQADAPRIQPRDPNADTDNVIFEWEPDHPRRKEDPER